mmetsp:Transcript_10388/g.20137  ORF Transcript_10388/g.20137 Transcript_10388/m.20137 type:complete len:247 (-) Transcript_10388:532-1272(-)
MQRCLFHSKNSPSPSSAHSCSPKIHAHRDRTKNILCLPSCILLVLFPLPLWTLKTDSLTQRPVHPLYTAPLYLAIKLEKHSRKNAARINELSTRKKTHPLPLSLLGPFSPAPFSQQSQQKKERKGQRGDTGRKEKEKAPEDEKERAQTQTREGRGVSSPDTETLSCPPVCHCTHTHRDETQTQADTHNRHECMQTMDALHEEEKPSRGTRHKSRTRKGQRSNEEHSSGTPTQQARRKVHAQTGNMT